MANQENRHARGLRLTVWAALLSIFLVLLAACGLNPLAPQTDQNPGQKPPAVFTGQDAKAAVEHFLQLWKMEDYPGMFAQLTGLSQDAISLDEFEKRYRETAAVLGLQGIDPAVLSVLQNGSSAQVSYRITYHTSLFSDLNRDLVMNVVYEGEAWRVQWEEGMILPELRGGNRLYSDYTIPSRGDIYDRSGKIIAAMTDAAAVGVRPADLVKEQESDLLLVLSQLTGRTAESLQLTIEKYRGDDYIALGETNLQQADNLDDDLKNLDGLMLTPYRGRYYFNGGVAPQAMGYLLAIPPERLEEYQRKGYSGDEWVGAAGLEEWAEPELAGKRGASVYVIDSQGNIITRLAQTNPVPANFLYTTLDSDLQLQAQQAIEGFRGAIVVLERDTGRVLAMVSSPGFDLNSFEGNNYNSSLLLNEAMNDPQQRLLNRATQGTYPLGSVFKIITMSAALDTDLFSQYSKYECGYKFTELQNAVLYDWTYTYGKAASGELTLPEGLVRSCNPWFWHIGLEMYNHGYTKEIAEMANGFGLGRETGLQELPEATGGIPIPEKESEAVHFAIGQGDVLVTPLQVAVMMAALGNGGTIYQPQLVEKYTTPDGQPSSEFKPIMRGILPIPPETMQILRDALRAVVADAKGTANYAFTGLQIKVFGKTGTAENPAGDAHSWFAGFTDAGRTDKPDIAMVVIAENAGEGSAIAAPIFRRVVEIYFSGKPARLYPWESQLYVTRGLLPTAVPTRGPEEIDSTPTPESLVP
ncbi:MAG: penicillin-binding transpeptidase domain-containing protein [Anaerolineaceae bacterium]